MKPKAILDRARVLGLTLTVSQGKIRYAPMSCTPVDFLRILQENKQELLAFLSREQDLSPGRCTQNPQNPQNSRELQNLRQRSGPDLDTPAELLAWATELSNRDIELASPVTYIEAPLRRITTARVSYYVSIYLRTVTSARIHRNSGGWGSWTPQWWQEREDEAIRALTALREAVEATGQEVQG